MNAKFKFSILGIAVILSQFSIWAQGTFQPAAPSGTFVIPPGAEHVEGDKSLGYTGFSGQQLISPAAFPQLPSQGVWLTGLSFRRDGGFGTDVRSFDNFEIALSSNPQGGPPNFFVPGSDRKVVFSAPITFQFESAPGGPAPFTFTFTFREQFFYVPGASLLFELSARGNEDVPLDYASSSALIFVAPTCCGPGGSVVPAFGNEGIVIQFSYQTIPEPTTSLLLAVGSLALMCKWKNERRDGKCH